MTREREAAAQGVGKGSWFTPRVKTWLTWIVGLTLMAILAVASAAFLVYEKYRADERVWAKNMAFRKIIRARHAKGETQGVIHLPIDVPDDQPGDRFNRALKEVGAGPVFFSTQVYSPDHGKTRDVLFYVFKERNFEAVAGGYLPDEDALAVYKPEWREDPVSIAAARDPRSWKPGR